MENPDQKLASLADFLIAKESEKVFTRKIEKLGKDNNSLKVIVADQQSASSLEAAIKESDVLNEFEHYIY